MVICRPFEWLRQKLSEAYRGSDKVADKPHPVTVLVGIITLFASLGGYVIAYEAYTVSERNMKVGQRAYLASSFALQSFDGDSRKDSQAVVQVRIRNLGNTPARFISSAHWTRDGNSGTDNEIPQQELRGISIGPKDEYSFTQALFHHYHGGRAMNYVRYHGEVLWKDVFEQTHKLGWCIVFEADNKNSHIWPCWEGNYSE